MTAGCLRSSSLRLRAPILTMRLGACGRHWVVRPEGANHLWRRVPPGELSIDPEADERLVQVTEQVGAS